MEDTNTLLRLVGGFQEWSELKISIKKSLVTGDLCGKGEAIRQHKARKTVRKHKPRAQLQATSMRSSRRLRTWNT